MPEGSWSATYSFAGISICFQWFIFYAICCCCKSSFANYLLSLSVTNIPIGCVTIWYARASWFNHTYEDWFISTLAEKSFHLWSSFIYLFSSISVYFLLYYKNILVVLYIWLYKSARVYPKPVDYFLQCRSSSISTYFLPSYKNMLVVLYIWLYSYVRGYS